MKLVSVLAEPFAVANPAVENQIDTKNNRIITYYDALLIVVLQLLLYEVCFSWCQLPEQSYFAPYLFLESLKHPSITILFTINLLIGCIFIRTLAWHSIDPTYGARLFIFLVAMIVTWEFATYDYNFYYNQAHSVDRFLLVVLGILIYIHPLFVPLFTIAALMVALQLQYPLPEAAWIWADKKLPLDTLILFTAFLIFSAFRKTARHTFLFLALCLTGGIYFHAGMAKLAIGPYFYSWVLDDHLSNLIVSSYLQGWFGFIDPGVIVSTAKLLRAVDLPMALGTLAIELTAIFIVWSRRTSQIVLTSIILLHAAIALASGIFFWQWSMHDLALLLFIHRVRREPNPCSYSRKSFLLSVAIISLSFLYFRPIPFAWFDTKLSNFFTIYGIGDSGRGYKLEPHFFSPYVITFGQSRFYYLISEKVLVGTYGSSQSHWIAQQLEAVSAADVIALKDKYGESFYDEQSSRSFDNFLRRYLANTQIKGTKFLAVNRLGPPYHFGRAAAQDAYSFQEQLDRIHLYYEEYFFDGESIRRIQKTLIMEILLTNSGNERKYHQPSGSLGKIHR